jgi:hypothetical protein
MTWWEWVLTLIAVGIALYLLDVGETIIERLKNFRGGGGN